jgi:HTH-type transcriptional regulator / antitoxin HigA
LDADNEPFLDDLSLVASDDKEKEADRHAREGLISEEQWEEFSRHHDYSPMAVFRFAYKLEIHPAIVAGRIRHEEKNYRLLSQFVGSGEIRSQFPKFGARKGA